MIIIIFKFITINIFNRNCYTANTISIFNSIKITIANQQEPLTDIKT